MRFFHFGLLSDCSLCQMGSMLHFPSVTRFRCGPLTWVKGAGFPDRTFQSEMGTDEQNLQRDRSTIRKHGCQEYDCIGCHKEAKVLI